MAHLRPEGTGFVAGWCITGLLDRGYAVRATIRNLAKEAAVPRRDWWRRPVEHGRGDPT
jgi:hypothetical protein